MITAMVLMALIWPKMKCFRCELNANGRSMRMAGEDPEKIGENRTKKQFEYDK